MAVFLDYLDQLRYIVGILLIVLLTCHNVLPRRDRFVLRLGLSCIAAVVLALAFVPLKSAMDGLIQRNPLVTGPYWLLMSFVPTAVVLLCYETNLAGALFRTMMGSITENFATVLIRYFFVLCLFPDYPERHPLRYGALMVLIYGAVYAGAYFLMCRRIRADESGMYPNPRATAWSYLFTYVSYTAILGATKVVCENLIQPLRADFASIYQFLLLFLVGLMLLVSVVVGFLMISAYNMVSIQNERQIVMQMVKDRQAQYALSRENIDMINRKAHDLKHQLRALELVSDEERRQQLREAREAIDFYDAVVKTGNEALDTLLTEKSVYCRNRDIRLSCTVSTQRLDKIGLVDLYTLLGNAMDNAIESVDKLSEPDKKTISLTIRDQGQMLFFHIENYFDGTLTWREGLPQTTKRDDLNHGFGTRSIRAIAGRYGGEVMIQTEGQIFSLEVLIPT